MVLSAAAFIGLGNRARVVSFAILWFFLTLGPVLKVRWLAVSAYAERYLYLPSAAFCWLLGEGLARLTRPRFSPRARCLLAYVLPGAVVAMASARTLARLPDWKSDYTLARATVREVPDAAPYHVYLGNAYRAHGERERARQEYVTALAGGPYLCEAYVNLAGVFMDDDRVEGARALLRRAVRADPAFADAHSNLGSVYARLGDHGRAEREFRRTIQLDAANPPPFLNLAGL